MATSEPLVPKGLPKGERQRTRENMQRAGIPLAPRASGQRQPGPAVTPAAAHPATRILSENTPADFPFLSEPTEAPTAVETAAPSEPGSQIDALAASSQSTFGTAVMARLMARRGR